MKKFIYGMAFSSLSLSAYADTMFLSEVLIGQSKHKANSSLKTDLSEKHYASSLDADSFAFRLGAKLTDKVSIELAKHDHGKVVNEYSFSVPSMAPTGEPLPPEFDRVYKAKIPIDIESLRIGVKGEWDLSAGFSLNARLGLAHWKFDEFSPRKLTDLGPYSDSGESGNDIYYAVGGEYKFTENLYVGLEYSLLSIKEKSGKDNSVRSSYEYDVRDLSFVVGWVF
ncbi:outer membrane beta-barrel protein [Thalassomonas viridans]|uniref:Outer membrane beta-barrel protein n=1 Tax=Thalassomonas viridans TaxID=137584 RepID=A0AAF0CAS6_9GAMM|nr:outer membrane beta-barrel protein [Thalassomonas viridans]WDE06029.1 outer membrane beta-barrel protein [Thalassomonas viridans]